MTTALSILFAVGMSKWAIAPVIIAAGISALSNLAGNYMSSKANKEAAASAEAANAKNRQIEEAWYKRNYYGDYTQRADAQRAINMITEEMKNRNRATAGRAAMGGATEEAVAQEKALGNQAIADTISGIAAEGAKHKAAIDSQHLSAQLGFNDIDQQNASAEAARKSQNMAAAVSAAGSLASSIVGNMGSGSGGGNSTAATTKAAAAGIQDSNVQLNKKPYDIDNTYTA